MELIPDPSYPDYRLQNLEFERRFIANPRLDRYADKEARTWRDALVRGAKMNGIDVLDTTAQDVHFAIKKLLGMFTDPDNLPDTVSRKSLEIFFDYVYKEVGPSLRIVPNEISHHINQAEVLYIPWVTAELGEGIWAATDQQWRFNAAFAGRLVYSRSHGLEGGYNDHYS